MATVSEIWVKINSDITGLQRGLATSSTELKAFGASSSKVAAESTAASAKLNSSFGSIGSTLKTLSPAFVVVGGLAVGAIVKGIEATTEWASQVRSLQRVTGQTAESASALAGAAAQLGIPVSKLNIGFGLLSKNIVNNAANLTKYGIATKDATGNILPFDDVLAAVSDKFATLPKGPEQAAFAMNVFGRSGKDLIPILQKGAAGLAELEQHAKDAGLVMSQDDVDAAKALTIAQNQLGEAFKGASVKIGKDFIPVATTLVHAITDVVEAFTKLPQSVTNTALVLTVVTGALAGVQLAAGFFTKTWSGVLGALGLTGKAGTDAAVGIGASGTAAGASVIPTEALTTAVADLVIALGGTVGASRAATGALVGYGETETGLLVPTEALTAANLDLAASETAAGGGAAAGATRVSLFSRALAGAKIGAAGFLSVVTKLAPALAGGFIIGSIPELPQTSDLTKINSLLGTLQKGITDAGGASKLTGDQQKYLTQETQFATSALGANAQAFALALKEGIPYQQALQEIAGGQTKTATSAKTLLGALRDTFSGIDDGTVKVSSLTGAMDLFAQATDPIAGKLDHLSQVSGQDFSSIRTDLLKALSTATVSQIPSVFAAALGQVKAEVKAWHDSIVQNFGGAQAAMSQFLGQAAGKGPNKVSFDNLTNSLAKTQTQLHRWSSDFSTILQSSGDKAKTFLQDMSANGLQSIGILDVVAQQPKKIRDQFLAQYNDVNRSTDTVASKIVDAFDSGVDKVVASIDRIYNVFAKLLGLPPIKIRADTTQAQRSIHDLVVALQGVKNKDITVRYHQVGSVQHPVPFHVGGLVMHAGGMVKRMHAGSLASDEVPAILQRGEFVVRRQAVQSIGVPTLRRLNRMHDGGPISIAVPSAPRQPAGNLTKREMTEAFREALRAEREKLYVDRRRFGRDLDEAVLTDGHW